MSKIATDATKAAFGHAPYRGVRQCAVRLPEGVWLRLKAQALKENRSIQAQIESYVTAGVEVDESWDD